MGEKWSFATLKPQQTGSVMPNFVCHNTRLRTVVPLVRTSSLSTPLPRGHP